MTMSLVTDEQIFELETYLDGELSSDESAALNARLASDAVLMQTLNALRAERSIRLEAFAAIEEIPTRVTTRDLMSEVRRAATREQVWQVRNRYVRQFAAVAACIIVGVCVGWFGRGKLGENSSPATISHTVNSGVSSGNASIPVMPVAAQYPADHVNGVPYAAQGNPGVQLVSDEKGTHIVPRINGFNVSVTDDLGRVIGVQHFDTIDEAKKFSNDLGAWQNKQRQLRNSNVKLVGDEF